MADMEGPSAGLSRLCTLGGSLGKVGLLIRCCLDGRLRTSMTNKSRQASVVGGVSGILGIWVVVAVSAGGWISLELVVVSGMLGFSYCCFFFFFFFLK